MSTVVNGTKIYMTRGDTPTLNVNIIIAATGEAYTPAAGDSVIFRLKRTPNEDTILLQKNVEDGVLAFDVNDTAYLAFGNYRYSLELVTAGGYHETFVEPTGSEGVFVVGEENENHVI